MTSPRTLFLLAACILCPIVDFRGHLINPVEFYLYALFFLNLRHIKKHALSGSYLVYAVLFFVTTLFTAWLAGKALNNHDFYILRNIVQSIIALYLFSIHLDSPTPDPQHEHLRRSRSILLLFTVLSIPSLLVFLQRFDILSLRSVVVALYKPQFHYLGQDVFESFRYTSVFKDFFSFAVYSCVLCPTLFYVLTRERFRPLQKSYGFLLLLTNYLAQFFVSRTGILLIPLLLLLTSIGVNRGRIHRLFKPALLGMVLISALGMLTRNIDSLHAVVNVDWVLEGLSLLQGGDSSSSFSVMNEWNTHFFDYLIRNPSILFIPNHDYDLNMASGAALYTDSFFPQEIYRYGIYGIGAFFVLVGTMLARTLRDYSFVAFLVLILTVLNYKGGNTFFMHRNIYMYAFLFAFLIFHYDRRHKEVKG